MTNANVSEHSGSKEVTVVGFGTRLLATVIDGITVGFFGFMLSFVIGFIAILVDIYTPEPASGPLELLIVLCMLGFSLVYYVGLWSSEGSTLGKSVLGLRVVGTDGSQLTTGKALLRYFGYIISALVLSIGFIWAAFDGRRQGWHDKIAGTLVIYSDEQFTADEKVVFIPSDSGRKGWVWAVLWVITAVTFPLGALSAFLALGPYITLALVNLVRNIF